MGGASVFRVERASGQTQFLKIAEGEQGKALRQEIERTAWLRSHGINVPKILNTIIDGQRTALLMSAVTGVPAEEKQGPPNETIDSIGRAMAHLHAVPVELCPFDERLTVRLMKAEIDVGRGGIDPDDFDERNRGVSPGDLLTRLVETAPDFEDLVVVHGDATFANIIVDSSDQVGFIDCGRCGVADRYVDLSVIAWEIENNFGQEWIDRFFRAYGLAERYDRNKLRYYSDLYEFF
jgi:aminoglycoside 3'-phosphotransferase-2